ncbi:MAG: DUF5916 domain-containing protein [Rhodothermales bacterium]
MTYPASLIYVFGLALCCAGPALAVSPQTQDPARSLRAHPAGDAVIEVDGFLDEPVWAEAEVVTDFLQFEPVDGAASGQRTEVRVVYGSSSLYVGATLFDDNPAAIEAALGRRDEYNRADWFLVAIDSYFDKKTAYTFGVNAAGVQMDAIQTSNRRSGLGNAANPGGDLSWDAIWLATPRIGPDGWTVEMRIPYSMLRFPERPQQTWGIQFTRVIPRLGEQSEWPYIPRGERTNLVARFGELTDLNGVHPRRNIQITPYTLSRLQRNEDPASPGDRVGERSLDVGGDLKVGLGPNVTFDATINPDFGQVESDPSVLNLTAFEIVFQERRPFFLEGMQIYDFDVGPAQMPYTRRIGAQAPIIGAAKLSGRTESGLSFGLLGATTGDDFDPSQQYGVARVTQQLGDFSRIGAIVTGFGGPGSADDSRLHSYFSGIDYDFRFRENMYSVEGFIGTTRRRQTEFDVFAENGFGGKMLWRKRRGRFTGFGGAEGFDEHFVITDIGLLRQNNYVAFPLRLAYDLNGGQPFGPFLRATLGDFGMQQVSLSNGLDLGQRHNFSLQGLLKGFRQFNVSALFENVFGGYDIYETRGQLPWVKPFVLGFEAEVATDQRRAWQVEPSVMLSRVDNGGRLYGFGLGGMATLGSRVSLSGTVDGVWEDDVVAWAANEAFRDTDTGWLIGGESGNPDLASTDFVRFDDRGQLDAAFAGRAPLAADRYYASVFGRRDTRSMDLTLRSTVTFTPKLSVQVYSQLFLARGRYDTFELLRDRDTLVPFDAYPKRNEFAFSTLTSNVVLRWEYRPGSTLFVVWTHGRRTDDVLNPLAPWFDSPYDRSIGGQIDDTFGIIPTNVFLVKLSYAFLN